jgi:hypothetical protein
MASISFLKINDTKCELVAYQPAKLINLRVTITPNELNVDYLSFYFDDSESLYTLTSLMN